MTVARRLALAAGALFAGTIAVAPVLAASASVAIRGLAFEPATITVAPGDTVTWTVEGAIVDSHSVTARAAAGSDPLFDSGIVLKATGDAIELTFPDAGEYAYFCIVHASQMTGTVIVAEASGGHEAVAPERKVLAGGILAISIVLMFGLAWLWRRVNPA